MTPTPAEFPTPWMVEKPSHAPRIWVMKSADGRVIMTQGIRVDAAEQEALLRRVVHSANAEPAREAMRLACEYVVAGPMASEGGTAPHNVAQYCLTAANKCRHALALDAAARGGSDAK